MAKTAQTGFGRSLRAPVPQAIAKELNDMATLHPFRRSPMREQDWLILRCAGRSTLPLAESLSRGGFQVWTPSATQVRRVPRKNFRHNVTLPMMPSFVFARADRLVDLLDMANARKVHRHPSFTVFHYLDQIPLVADRDLEPLRMAEKRAVPVAKRPTFNRGQTVRVPTGAFEGLSGIVEKSDGKFTLVCFGHASVKISTFILEPTVDRRAA
jgi:transcription antitermination factor NusG